jgi:hypothetical protein
MNYTKMHGSTNIKFKFICFNLFLKLGNASLAFSVQPVKCQISAVSRILFSLNAHGSTVVFHLAKNSVLVVGKHCPTHLLKIGADLKMICSGG